MVLEGPLRMNQVAEVEVKTTFPGMQPFFEEKERLLYINIHMSIFCQCGKMLIVLKLSNPLQTDNGYIGICYMFFQFLGYFCNVIKIYFLNS